MYKVKKASKKDLAEIMKLYHSLIGTPVCTWNLDYPTIEDVKSDIEKKSLYLICDDKNIIIGVAAAVEDEELKHLTCWNKEIENPADLARIGVKKHYQGQGIAKKLLEVIEEDISKRNFDGIHFLVSKKIKKLLIFTIILIIKM